MKKLNSAALWQDGSLVPGFLLVLIEKVRDWDINRQVGKDFFHHNLMVIPFQSN
ncbi:hypothetical protein ACSF6K_00640 [Escherichia coli]|uniref:hypothetical protein n=1 Tax=Escherichia coli TaxID=562 RepID=UPI003EEDE07E